MEYEAKRYTVITGASSGIGYETAKAFAARGKNVIVAARRKGKLETLRNEILREFPTVDVVIKTFDLSVLENVYQLYSDLQDFQLETWINNAGFGNYDSVAHQDLNKISAMIRLNIETLTILSSLFVRDYKDVPGTQLINISSCGGYTIVPTAVTYCAAKFYVSSFCGYLLRGKVLCQFIYRRVGLGVKRNRGGNAGQGIGSGSGTDRVWKGGESCQ